jgi:hypothetical protein
VCIAGRELSRDEKHDPAQDDGRSDKEDEAVNSEADHAQGRIPHGNAKDSRGEQGI